MSFFPEMSPLEIQNTQKQRATFLELTTFYRDFSKTVTELENGKDQRCTSQY